MNCLKLISTDPFFNLAAEEYLLKNTAENFLILGINDPSVIIGKHQVAHRETDTQFVTENNIPVIRRISGGGTVFHDFGNVNFSFIIRTDRGMQVDFRKYTLPVIGFLASEGINARLGGKSDLRVDDLKISGNAEHVYRERVLHHGTLLFSADLNRMKHSLRKDTSCYITRAVESNPSHVLNLKNKTDSISDPEEFRERMLRYFLNMKGNSLFILTPSEENMIGSLADSRYRTWEWNYAYGPEYIYSTRFEINNNIYTCRIIVSDGIIRECEIEGSEEIAEAAKKLTGCKHMPEDMLRIFQNGNFPISGSDIFKFF